MACYDSLPLTEARSTTRTVATATSGQVLDSWLYVLGGPPRGLAQGEVGRNLSATPVRRWAATVTLEGGLRLCLWRIGGGLWSPSLRRIFDRFHDEFFESQLFVSGAVRAAGVCSDNTTVNCNTSGISFFNDNFAVVDPPGTARPSPSPAVRRCGSIFTTRVARARTIKVRRPTTTPNAC